MGVRCDYDQVERELKLARTRVPNMVRGALRESAELEALPRVRAASPSFGASLLVARSGMRQAYITTVGKKEMDRALGLLNYGGTVRGRVVPKRVKRAAARAEAGKEAVKRGSGPRALALPGGLARAAVNKPRTYRGQHFLERGVAMSVPAMATTFRNKALSIFEGLRTERGA